MYRMLLWSSLIIISCLGPSAGRSQNGVTFKNNEAEITLEFVSNIREDLLKKLNQGNSSNSICSCSQGIRDLSVDLFDILKSVASSKSAEGVTSCANQAVTVYDQVKNISQDNSKSEELKKVLTYNTDVVIQELKKSTLMVTKPLLVGLLENIPNKIHTPDFVTLLQDVASAVKSQDVKVSSYKVNEGVEDILEGVLSENDLSPSVSFQVMQLISTLDDSVRQTIKHPLQLIRADEFPSDVIVAKDTLLEALNNGSLKVSTPLGWEKQPDILLVILTKLLNIPNNDPFSVSIHVVYSHYRMKYLAFHGYIFQPKDISDIAFLLNSFLTIRSPALIQAMFSEFARDDLPWKDLINNLDYSQYSSPRTLFMDIVKSIVHHPESLKICNTILFNFFLNADKNSTLQWLGSIFPNTTDHLQPIDLSKLSKATIEEVTEGSQCPGEEVTIIDPDCLLEIVDTGYHIKLISDFIRHNPALAEDYPYNTRIGAFKAILEDLKRYKYKDDISEFVITQAILRMPMNNKQNFSLEFKKICPDDLGRIREKAPPVPSTDSPSMNEPTTDNPEECEESGESESKDECKKVTVINQESLVNIIQDKHIRTLKELLYWKPVMYDDYKALATRENVLKKVLEDRQQELSDDILNFVILQILQGLSISWAGSLPPVVEEICENDLKYNSTFPVSDSVEEFEEQLPCTEEKTINPQSLIELLPKGTHTKWIERLIKSKPILATDYKDFTKRGPILKAILITRSEELNNYETAIAVRKAVSNIKLNWKANLPIEYLELCPKPTIDNVFAGVVEGLGEATIPCEIEGTTELVPPQESENKNNCSENEVETRIVDIESLWEALSETAPKAPLIRAKMKSFVVPYEKGVIFTKALVLRQVLENLKLEIKEPRVLQNLQLMINCVLKDGPGLQEPEATTTCLSSKAIEESDSASTDNPKCNPDEVLTTVVDGESLYDAFLPNTPKAPYIRKKISSYIYPMEDNKIYTKSGILKEILSNLKEDVTDIRVLRNIDILLKFIRTDGLGLEEPATKDTCVLNLCQDEEVDDTEKSRSPYLTTTQSVPTYMQGQDFSIVTTPGYPSQEETTPICNDSDIGDDYYQTTPSAPTLSVESTQKGSTLPGLGSSAAANLAESNSPWTTNRPAHPLFQTTPKVPSTTAWIPTQRDILTNSPPLERTSSKETTEESCEEDVTRTSMATPAIDQESISTEPIVTAESTSSKEITEESCEEDVTTTSMATPVIDQESISTERIVAAENTSSKETTEESCEEHVTTTSMATPVIDQESISTEPIVAAESTSSKETTEESCEEDVTTTSMPTPIIDQESISTELIVATESTSSKETTEESCEKDVTTTSMATPAIDQESISTEPIVAAESTSSKETTEESCEEDVTTTSMATPVIEQVESISTERIVAAESISSNETTEESCEEEVTTTSMATPVIDQESISTERIVAAESTSSKEITEESCEEDVTTTSMATPVIDQESISTERIVAAESTSSKETTEESCEEDVTTTSMATPVIEQEESISTEWIVAAESTSSKETTEESCEEGVTTTTVATPVINQEESISTERIVAAESISSNETTEESCEEDVTTTSVATPVINQEESISTERIVAAESISSNETTEESCEEKVTTTSVATPDIEQEESISTERIAAGDREEPPVPDANKPEDADSIISSPSQQYFTQTTTIESIATEPTTEVPPATTVTDLECEEDEETTVSPSNNANGNSSTGSVTLADVAAAQIEEESTEIDCAQLGLHWPLLLKPQFNETCINTEGKLTSPVEAVNITELLEGAEGSTGDLYVIAARLASIDSYHKLRNFNIHDYETKASFLRAVTNYLEIELKVTQRSTNPVQIEVICDSDLWNALPRDVTRSKRKATMDDKINEERMQEAVEIAHRLLIEHVKLKP